MICPQRGFASTRHEEVGLEPASILAPLRHGSSLCFLESMGTTAGGRNAHRGRRPREAVDRDAAARGADLVTVESPGTAVLVAGTRAGEPRDGELALGAPTSPVTTGRRPHQHAPNTEERMGWRVVRACP